MITQKLKKLFLVTSTLVFIGSASIAQAQTDDARVLGGLDSSTDIYKYLNTYPFHIWKLDHQYSFHDTYISNDNCVIVYLYDNYLSRIYILGSGYTTDKGIQVGMTAKDIEAAYGPIYSPDNEPSDYNSIYGLFVSNAGAERFETYRNYTGYDTIQYRSPRNEEICFILNRYTGKIEMIVYTTNLHGNYNGFEAAVFSHILHGLK